ncbi:MAG: choice-of-anchor B family protein [Chloroflexi bacterium]|nr:choice-of-anchor B family protein [Chloroflexota bacterium]
MPISLPARLSWLLGLVVVLLIGLAWRQADVAAQAGPPPTPTAAMAAMLRDVQPAQTLAPQSLTPCVSGFAGIYPCQNVDLLAFMPLASIGGGSGNDIWGWTDPVGGKEYALMGRTNGTAFVDISDPENPLYLGNLPTHTATSIWRDIKVYANHAFIVSEASGHGMQVFDLTQLRNVPITPATFSSTAHYGSFGNAHNIVINEDTGFAYAVGTSTCSGGLHMVNIQNPISPTFAGCFSSDGYTHDAHCLVYSGPDAQHQGKEICFNSNEDTLTIVDVTNKVAPAQLSRTGYAGSAYTHQGWVDPTHTYYLQDDELDESNWGHNTRTYVWDISNLDAPVLLGNYTSSTPAIDHNLYITGNLVYQSNYRAGLRILQVNNYATSNLEEVGYFDIYPANNNANFNGSWSNYPYFASGVVVVSGIEQGLFILQPQLGDPTYGVALSPDDTAVAQPGATVTYTVQITNTGSVADTFNLAVTSSWPTELSTLAIALDSGQSSSFTATVQVPLDAAAGDSDAAVVTAVSQADGSVSEATQLTTSAAALYGAAIAGPASGSALPGTAITYTLRLTNTGNITDTFSLTADADWLTAVAPTTATLAANTATDVLLTVHVPLTATLGLTDTAVFQATSTQEPAATADWSITTTAVPYTLFLPIIGNNFETAHEIACVDGMAGDYPCKNANYLSFLSLADLGATSGQKAANLWGWTDPQDNNEYVLLGLTDKLAFINTTNPLSPVIVGFLPNQTNTNPVAYRDVKVYQHYAFVIADENSQHGLQVFDLHHLRGVAGAPVTFSADATYNAFGNAHNFFIHEATGYAYIVRNTAPVLCSSAVYILNVQDPLNPTFVNCYDEGGAASDVMCVLYNGPDVDYHGRELCLVASDDEILVADMTDKNTPTTLATLTYPAVHRAHLAWFTEDHRYFLSSDMEDEMMMGFNTRIFVWDFTQVDAPVLQSIYVGPTPASDHNVWVKGEYAYVGNFRAGVRILGLQDIANTTMNNVTITEAAYFDTYPANDNTGHMGGVWAVYPFFASGVTAVSDRETGLYLVRPVLP